LNYPLNSLNQNWKQRTRDHGAERRAENSGEHFSTSGKIARGKSHGYNQPSSSFFYMLGFALVNIDSNRWAFLLTLIGTAVPIYILIGNFDNGLWFDEMYSLQVTDPVNTLDQALAIQSIDASPFAYYFFLRLWRILFGPDFYTAQFFNITVLLVAIVLAWVVWPKNKIQEFLFFLSLNISCAAVLYYLLEIRSYALMFSVSLFMASCLNRLINQIEISGGGGRSKILYIAIIVSAALVMNLHAWGAIFGAGIIFALFFYDLYYADRTFCLPAFVVSGVIITALFIAFYVSIIGVFGSRLNAAGITVSTNVAGDPLILLTGIWHLLYVTDRSAVFGAIALLLVVYLCVVRFSAIRSSLLVYITPIIFVYVIVIVAHLVFDRFIYKSYFNIIFFPFIFIFLARVAYSAATGAIRIFLIGTLILANLGSIPFFEKFAEQPIRLEILDGKVVYVHKTK